MRRIAAASLITAFAVAASCAHAQTTRPGLWEITHKMSGNAEMDAAMAEMHKQMAAMPPEQRKMMEDMLAKQGVSPPGAGADGGVSVKVCISPAMAEKMDLPRQTEGDCTSEITERSAGRMSMRFSCTNPPSSGEGTYTFPSDTAYTMAMKMRTTHQGKTQDTRMEGKGKWLASDCGSIKPVR